MRGITKSFHAGIAGCSARVRALDGVDLRVLAGEIVGIVGAKGAGKTTLLRCATGLVVPDRGLIERDGEQLVLIDDPAVDGDESSWEALARASIRAAASGKGVVIAGRTPHLERIATRLLYLEAGRLRGWPSARAVWAPARVAEHASRLTPLPGEPSIP